MRNVPEFRRYLRGLLGETAEGLCDLGRVNRSFFKGWLRDVTG